VPAVKFSPPAWRSRTGPDIGGLSYLEIGRGHSLSDQLFLLKRGEHTDLTKTDEDAKTAHTPEPGREQSSETQDSEEVEYKAEGCKR